MTFKKLSFYLQELEKTPSRLAMMEILSRLFTEAKVEEIDKICYLSLGKLGPKYEAEKFQLADKLIIRALAQAFGVDESIVKEQDKELGDLGEVGEGLKAQSSKFKVQSSKLAVLTVYGWLTEIARESGEGSVERKINKLAHLFNDLDGLGVRYVVRILLEKLRLGFSDVTILDGLSYMIAGDKSLSETMRQAYEMRADIGWVALKVKSPARGAGRRQLKVGKLVEDLKKVQPLVGVPIMPALCQRLGTAEEILEKVGGPAFAKAIAGKRVIAVEPKFDGTRLQIHVGQSAISSQQSAISNQQSGVSIFTRNLENVTHMFPEIAEAVKKSGQNLILDGEAIGIDPKTGKLLPFQETIKRKRKHGIQSAISQIPLVCYCFDILHLGGKNLISLPFSKRRKILEKLLKTKGKDDGERQVLRLTLQTLVDNPDDLRQIHQRYIDEGLEGIVVKNWQAPYDPGKRGFTWVKLKQEETKKGGGLADTVDCLVMGYNKGKGKRTVFGIGAFLVGVKLEKGRFVTISKIGTGLTDEQWQEMKVRGSKFEVAGKPKEYDVDKNLYPDVWCSPGIVVEIQADNITKSPIHTAGLAFRFPRLKRFRDDKSPNQVTTVKEVEKLYKLQFK